MHRALPRATLLLLSALAIGQAQAATASARFGVTIHFKTADGLCVSRSLSDQTNATVRVVCETGQFVSISPTPGKPFFGTHGAAFRFSFSSEQARSVGRNDESDPFVGFGTVTSLQIYNASGSDGPIEMLVSF
jgi:hypothetical protein